MEQEEQSYESYARKRLETSPLANLFRGVPVDSWDLGSGDKTVLTLVNVDNNGKVELECL